MAEISVVVPVFHNEESLPDLFAALQKTAASGDFQFVFVDDGSQDGSWRLLKEFSAREPRAKIVRLSRNFGSFTAAVAGLSQCSGKAAVIIAADLQDPPEMITRMVERWREGFRVVMAVRETREEPLLQRTLAAIYYRMMRLFALPDMPLGGFDFVLIDRKVIDQIVPIKEKNTTLMGLILWMGFKRAEIPYVRRARAKGRSMWTLKKKLKYFVDSLVAFSSFPIQAIQAAGLFFACAGFGYAMLLIALKIFRDIPIQGWTALMVTVLVLGGVQLLMLGVMGEYNWRTLDETKRRPLFVIDEVAGGLES